MLELQDIRKAYEGQPLLRGISFRVDRNETVCLLGPSGSGKSTILQLIAGLDFPESGRVLWNGLDLASTPAHLRDFGLVFQDYALFPHLDVLGNVAFGPRMKGWTRAQVSHRAAEVLDLVNLSGFEHRSVAELSGGEQQRVALARALAPRPRLLMFDEPLGALDRALRQELLDELRAVLSRARIPALYVTHDQEEAYRIADRMLLLHEGRIVRGGSPAEVWKTPGSPWAAGFLGLGNVIAARVIAGQHRIRTRYGSHVMKCRHHHSPGDEIHVLARPGPVPHGSRFEGTVREAIYQSDGYRIFLSNGLFFDSEQPRTKGDHVSVRLHLECLASP